MKGATVGPFERAKQAIARLWLGMREWCGDAAYDRYLKAHAKHQGGAAALSREDFYVEQLQRRYSRVSRCC